MDPPPTVPSGEVLEELSIHYRSELLPDGINVPGWLKADNIPEFAVGMRGLLASNIITNPMPAPGNRLIYPLTPDQLYTFRGHHYGERFFEVHGRIDTHIIAGRWWRRHQRNSRTLILMVNVPMDGRAGVDRWVMNELSLDDSRRASAYQPPGEVVTLRLMGIHHDLKAFLPPPHLETTPAWCHDIITTVPETLGVVSAMASDASYIAGDRSTHQMFTRAPASPTHAQGAFVLFRLACNRPFLAVIITDMDEIEQYNAFLGELYTGLAMAQFRTCLPGSIPAWLDCKSVLQVTDQRLPAASDFYCNLHDDYGIILHQFHRLRRQAAHPSLFQWTRGHPDQDRLRRDGTIQSAIPRHEWTQKVYGIYIADNMADLTDLARNTLEREDLSPEKVVEVSIKTILRAIPTARQWLVCSTQDPSIPILNPTRTTIDDVTFQDYCRLRDEASTRTSKWSSIQIGMLRPTLKYLGALGWASTWAKYMRVILDRLPHGRNLSKGNRLEDAEGIPVCPLCQDDEDSMEHLLR